jgi:hypothetical protein
VATDVFKVSGRAMMDALIAGERDPHCLAQLAQGRMKAKHDALVDALTAAFEQHHADMLSLLLATVDHLTGQIDALTARIGRLLAETGTPDGPGDGPGGGATADTPEARSRARAAVLPGGLPGLVQRLDAVPGIGPTTAQILLAEIGWDMSVFPTRSTWSPGPSCPHAPSSPAANPAPDRPGRATPGSRAPSARPPPPPPRPTPSSAPATGAWSNACPTRKPSSPSPDPCWSSSGT